MFVYLPLVVAPFPHHSSHHDIGSVLDPAKPFDGSITFVNFTNEVVNIVRYAGGALIVDAYWFRICVEVGNRLRCFDLLCSHC